MHFIIAKMKNSGVSMFLAKLVIVLSCVFLVACSIKTPLYKDKNAPVEKRVEDLLDRMSLQEKIEQLGGVGFDTKPNSRLGIPTLKMTDGPVGIRWGNATALPAAVALASSWDTDLLYRVGQLLGKETKAKGRNLFLGPCVNIHRFPVGGRNFESFGEDPYLAGQIAVPYIKGVQSQNVLACIKHFACNNQEWQRSNVNAVVDERALHEIYLPAFKAAVQEAGVWSVMSSYNKVNGHWTSENDYLLNTVLKDKWGFRGFVVSDWEATHSTVKSANAGLDLEMPFDVFFNDSTLSQALNKGEVSQETIDDKVRRLLRVRFLSGMFDTTEINNDKILHSKEHRELAYEAASKGIVLLKNDKKLLPIQPEKIKKIAVLGPNAAFARVGGGGSSKVTPFYSVSPLQALKQKIGNKSKIVYSIGTIIEDDIRIIENNFFVNNEKGLETNDIQAEYFKNISLVGEPLFRRKDKEINFLWYYDAPRWDLHGADDSNYFSVRWQGNIKPEISGKYVFTIMHNDGVRFWMNNQLVFENWKDCKNSIIDSVEVQMTANQLHAFKLEYYNNGGVSEMKLGWKIPGVDLMKDAVRLARESDVAVVFAGLSDHFEGEGRDRNFLVLENQDKLINEVVKVNPNTVVVIISGTPPIIESWADKVPVIVQAWFGGQEGGNAIADVLLGNKNPEGKLPCTFYQNIADSPGFNDYRDESLNSVYSEGIYIGYRYLDKFNIKPRFAFGHGLSFTQFQYNTITSSVDGDNVKVDFFVTNTGDVIGTETIQLYLDMPDGITETPEKQLKGFEKVTLLPGETKEVSIVLAPSTFKYYDVQAHDWKTMSGEHHLLVGSSSADIRLKEKIIIQ